MGAASTYIILDGTWKEARAIFRKGPSALRSMQCVALSPASPSEYVLRRNFGWRDRFGSMAEPCCTAEAAATLLEETGDVAGGALVRQSFDRFQAEYCSGFPHLSN